ncbi:MAG: hypothetical protein ACO1RX_23470 [Candidatus Sericytochromatia bacterium]
MPRLLAFLTLIGLAGCTPTASLPSEPAPLASASAAPSAQPTPSGETPSPAPSSATPSLSPSPSALPPGPATGSAEIQALQLDAPRFLSASGERLTLQVRDQNGNVIAPERLRFVSSRPQDLSVDAQGQVQAQVENGFSTITISLLGSALQIEQVFSITSSSGSGSSSGGGSSGAPTRENVTGQVAFQF